MVDDSLRVKILSEGLGKNPPITPRQNFVMRQWSLLWVVPRDPETGNDLSNPS